MPTRNRAISSIGRCVADRPTRVGGVAHSRSSRASDSDKMRAALVAGQRVNLVHDHRPHVAQHLAALRAGQQQIQRFGRRHQNMRRLAQHRLPLARRRVARAHRDANRLRLEPGRRGRLANLLAAAPADCGGCRCSAPSAARRRRPAFRPAELAIDCLPQQAIDRRQKRGQRLARPGRRGHQRVLAGHDRGPTLSLRIGRRIESARRTTRVLADERSPWHFTL